MKGTQRGFFTPREEDKRPTKRANVYQQKTMLRCNGCRNGSHTVFYSDKDRKLVLDGAITGRKQFTLRCVE